ncbi:SDR family NAD(P)-dependent oxidoreductase [Iamia majanohamensis]|uniref:SDR family NAD(P)-dependent oxidoreductase n=1 Tax=Iamia majanohamensis TaxID=467976 RepID=A0AAE9Y8J4_9ACTN|nr:SDR family NAD(P)-dependent oxidoreductase [Iamia majanohamensis]WCO66299.1 SDR family NAD(P)-dependent oxidoreductase [Iamia majanohamensis]
MAIVTGAGQGLGREHALQLAARGARVVVNDVGGSVDGTGADAGPAQQVADEINTVGGEAVANTDSVASQAGGEAIVRTALDAFGRLDIVVNNAGILRDKSFHNLTPDLLDPVMQVHLFGAFWVTLPAWKVMREQSYGRIINTTSAAGLFGNFGQTNYGAAKMGLVGLTKALAQEGRRRNVLANVIAPGARTRMTKELLGPLADSLDPEAVTPVVVYLASDQCDVTGQILSVAGGRVSRVVVAEPLGYFSDNLTPEQVRDNWESIASLEGLIVPENANEEIGLLLKVAR